VSYKTKHELYDMWKGMWQRCTNPNHEKYKYYGGRGISVCEEWRDFWVFVSDMGNRPHKHLIERVDNDKNYCKENCVWAPYHTQARNKRTNLKTKDGVALDSSAKLGGNVMLVQQRIKNLGWDIERATSEPVHKKPRQYVQIGAINDTPTGWARRLGLSQPAVSKMVKEMGATQAITHLIERANHALRQ
jgi:hypothetical protein